MAGREKNGDSGQSLVLHLKLPGVSMNSFPFGGFRLELAGMLKLGIMGKRANTHLMNLLEPSVVLNRITHISCNMRRRRKNRTHFEVWVGSGFGRIGRKRGAVEVVGCVVEVDVVVVDVVVVDLVVVGVVVVGVVVVGVVVVDGVVLLIRDVVTVSVP